MSPPSPLSWLPAGRSLHRRLRLDPWQPTNSCQQPLYPLPRPPRGIQAELAHKRWRRDDGRTTIQETYRLQQLRHCPPPSLHCLRHRPRPSRPRSSHGPLLPPHRLPYHLRSQPRRRPQLLGPSHLWVRRFLRLLQLLQHQQLRLPHPHACKRLLLHVRRRFQARNWLLPGCR